MNFIAAKIIFHIIFARYDYRANNLDLAYTYEVSLQYPREEIRFPSGTNTLCGRLYHTSASDPKGILIIVHGMHAYGDNYLDVAQYFVDCGWNVLTFDMTGTGASEGFDTVGLPQMKRDLLAAIDYVKKEPQLQMLPIVLYGHSMGGYAAAAAIENEPSIAAAVCISAFNKPTEIMMHRAREFGGNVVNLGYSSMYLENLFRFGNDANTGAADVINSHDVPVMVIQGKNDKTVPYEFSLYSHKDEITNPDVSFLFIEDDYRDEHSTAWLTEESAKYTMEVENKLDALEDEYKDEIPEEIFQTFREDTDMDMLYELEQPFMQMLDEFYTNAVSAAAE